jgi:hypothetical protein
MNQRKAVVLHVSIDVFYPSVITGCGGWEPLLISSRNVLPIRQGYRLTVDDAFASAQLTHPSKAGANVFSKCITLPSIRIAKLIFPVANGEKGRQRQPVIR